VPPLKPTGFWSYTSADDAASDGRLSRLRTQLANRLRQQVGRPVQLFQDVAAIPPGTLWEQQIESALAEASFFIPILTPGFLQSEWCAKEVRRFREHMEARGRDDLILPVHYMDVSGFATVRRGDCFDPDLLDYLRSLQWVDFRTLEPLDSDATEVRVWLAGFARRIEEALYRVVPPRAAPTPVPPVVEPPPPPGPAAKPAPPADRPVLETDSSPPPVQPEPVPTWKKPVLWGAVGIVVLLIGYVSIREAMPPPSTPVASVPANPAPAPVIAPPSQPAPVKLPSPVHTPDASVPANPAPAPVIALPSQPAPVKLPTPVHTPDASVPANPVPAPVIAPPSQPAPVKLPSPAPTPDASVPANPAPTHFVTIRSQPAPVAASSPPKEFRDICPADAICPEMVLIPKGGFEMGTTDEELEREKVPEAYRAWEKPRHQVTIGADFYMGKYAVTLGEFKAFARAKGTWPAGKCYAWEKGSNGKFDWQLHQDRGWDNPGFPQTDRDPVVCVSFDDAVAYVDWLNAVSGTKSYRLPSEAEWEYAARAKTTTSRFWGDGREAACRFANVADQALAKDYNVASPDPEHYFTCFDGFAFTAPVGSFQDNAFGLYDMLGNAWQWTADCWNNDQKDAPSNGSTRTAGDCSRRVVRGGSWDNDPRGVRAGYRSWDDTGSRFTSTGFRVARTL